MNSRLLVQVQPHPQGMIIATWLYPTRARIVATQHNMMYHRGVPTANIEYDPAFDKVPIEKHLPPRYRVVCSECNGAMA